MSIDSLFKTPVIVISDPEGHDIYSLMNKNFCTNTKIIICGDIIDSTMSSRNDIMYDPKICNDLKLDLFKNKSYNLHNLDEIDKKNISVFLGNRDLNKIKCVFLNKLKRIAGVNDTSKLINHFNNGNDYNLVNNLYKINVTNTDTNSTFIDNLQTQLRNTQFDILYKYINNNNDINFWEVNYREWGPFWGGHPKKSDGSVNTTVFGSTNFNTRNACTFYDRFNIIFGLDSSVGTMSAPNLLYTIPYELGIIDDNVLIFLIEKALNSNFKDDMILLLNFFAYIVLLTFNKLLNLSVSGNNTFNNFNKYQGLLWKLYTKNKLIDLKTNKGSDYYFSHSGITDLDNICRLYTKIMKDDSVYNYLVKGYYPSQPIVLDDTMVYTINDYNALYKTCIKNIMSSGPIDMLKEKSMLYLLINAATNCDVINSSIRIPVTMGINLTDESTFTTKTSLNKIVYQFIGHVPLGITSTIKKIKTRDEIIISLDNSNTWRFYFNNNTQNFAYINRNGDIYTISNIKINNKFLNSDSTKFCDYTKLYNIITDNVTELVDNKIKRTQNSGSYNLYIITSDINYFNDKLLNNDKIFKINLDFFGQINNLNINIPNYNLNFHFIDYDSDNNIYYIIFTIAGKTSPYNKLVYVLSFDDFNTFISQYNDNKPLSPDLLNTLIIDNNRLCGTKLVRPSKVSNGKDSPKRLTSQTDSFLTRLFKQTKSSTAKSSTFVSPPNQFVKPINRSTLVNNQGSSTKPPVDTGKTTKPSSLSSQPVGTGKTTEPSSPSSPIPISISPPSPSGTPISDSKSKTTKITSTHSVMNKTTKLTSSTGKSIDPVSESTNARVRSSSSSDDKTKLITSTGDRPTNPKAKNISGIPKQTSTDVSKTNSPSRKSDNKTDVIRTPTKPSVNSLSSPSSPNGKAKPTGVKPTGVKPTGVKVTGAKVTNTNTKATNTGAKATGTGAKAKAMRKNNQRYKYLKYKNKYLQLKDPINYKPVTNISNFSEDKVMKYKIKYLQLKDQLMNY